MTPRARIPLCPAELLVTWARKIGISGRQQGDVMEKTPAMNAVSRVTSVIARAALHDRHQERDRAWMTSLPSTRLHILRRIRCGRRHLDLIGVVGVNRGANGARRHSLVQSFDHGTRDPKTDASSGSHRIERNEPIGIHRLHVAVTVVTVPVL